MSDTRIVFFTPGPVGGKYDRGAVKKFLAVRCAGPRVQRGFTSVPVVRDNRYRHCQRLDFSEGGGRGEGSDHEITREHTFALYVLRECEMARGLMDL